VFLEALIYLWTRDAELAINKETENYVTDHLLKIYATKAYVFSDKARLAMVKRILNKKEGGINYLIMPASWRRAIKCLVPYFTLLGKYAWLKYENNHLRGQIMELKRSK